MHIIAIGWIYVVLMMAITEKSVIAGIMTFTFYCAIPLAVIWYLVSGKKRRLAHKQKIQEQADSTLRDADSGSVNNHPKSQN